jgi:hypothetical protein
LSTIDAGRTFFGANGDVYFLGKEDTRQFIYRIREDRSRLEKAIATPMNFLYDVSPDGKSLAVGTE